MRHGVGANIEIESPVEGGGIVGARDGPYVAQGNVHHCEEPPGAITRVVARVQVPTGLRLGQTFSRQAFASLIQLCPEFHHDNGNRCTAC